MYQFQGYNPKANAAMNAAIESAEEMGHTYIGSEHLMLGLLRVGDTLAYTALTEKGLSARDVAEFIRENVGVGSPTVLKPVHFTARCKHIIEDSRRESQRRAQPLTGPEHILISLMQEGGGAAAAILGHMNITPQEILDQLAGAVGGIGDTMESGVRGGRRGGKRGKVSDTPTLEKFGRDLTALAQDGKIDPVIGRQEEIERVVQILSRRTKNNPCLIGEPGVGKTAIAEGLALKIASGEVPEMVRGKRVISLDLTSMVAGTKYRGDFEERIQSAIEEVVKSDDVILFLDELHTIIGAGAAEGTTDAANILKPSLSRGELQLIGATTLDEYRKYIEKDAALERRFQPVIVEEPSEDEAVLILQGLRDKYEAHHKVTITSAAIAAAVKLSARYIGDRYLPDKAIDLVDEACSRVRLQAFTPPPDMKELEDGVEALEEEKAAAVNAQEFERAAQIRNKQEELKEQLETARGRWQQEASQTKLVVTESDIAQIVSSWTKIPVVQLTQEESERLLHMEEELHRRIVGQNEAVSAVSRAIRRGRVGLKDPKRPTGSFIFLGPTGVGKTELCKTLAVSLFGDEAALVRLDMSEYMEKHTVSRLIGSPPGYVGYDEGGQLTEQVRRRPYSVLLFDEVEKAHPDVFNILLQILEDGILTDAQGRRVDFKNCIIIMTSNIGASKITTKSHGLGFSSAEAGSAMPYEKIQESVMEELKKAFKPEFLNRVDEIIVFHQLNSEDIRKIAGRMLETLSARIRELGVIVDFDKQTAAKISDAGFDPVYGARPLRRAIQHELEDRLSEQMLEGKLMAEKSYVCTVRDGEFVFVENVDSGGH
ncbi:MAG: ATP-dependent Clp protease ATP-binding subunit [Oscillospiraceae bacterium]|jgi:ATP-dependent Clp protease ATP-binding subunit ClpC|nr:ATP-dependent Clp protease ATP-binding subunit [Oscillospiraceae bacterium]